MVTDTIKQYKLLQRQVHDHKGFLAEVYLSQILWNGQRKTFPGRYFHSEQDVVFPPRFYDMRHRLRLTAAKESEVDVYDSTGREIWLCESKWWETRPVGPDVVHRLLNLVEHLKDFEGREYFESDRPLKVYLWLFAHNGVTSDAERLLREHHIYWSDRADLDALIALTGLRKLPTFFEGELDRDVLDIIADNTPGCRVFETPGVLSAIMSTEY